MKKVKFIAFSCTHAPLQDEKAINWLCEQITEIKPDFIIHLGDMLEADSASRWDNENDWFLKEEFNSANEMLKTIRSFGSKDTRCIFLPGNHDDNILSINRLDKKIRGLCDYREEHNMPELYNNWEQPCEYIYDTRRGAFHLGQVTFAHGYEANASADEYHSYILGVPYGLYVGGHTHRPKPVTQCWRTKTVPLPFWYSNAGCMRNLDPEWMKRRRTQQWGQAIVCGETALVKGARYSRCWDAETRIFRMRTDI